tara:strand:- start:266 stop:820 length:555 start_codon:yes stop_codon:yes gene_type:complete
MKNKSLNRPVVKTKPIFQDGEWWYVRPEGTATAGKRERYSQYHKNNDVRMFIDGKYIPTSHPLHKPGRYKSLDDAWSHSEIEQTKEGEVYAITNPAFPDWVKVGCAVNADDRCKGYQTSSPFRDYQIIARMSVEDRRLQESEMHKVFEHFAKERRGEWFKIESLLAIMLFNHNVKEQQEKNDVA